MPWPEERLTDYEPGMQVKSEDLNAIQDEIIGGYDVRTRVIHAAAGQHFNVADPSWRHVANYAESVTPSGSMTALLIPLELEIGDRIRAVRVRWRREDVESMRLSLYRSNGEGSATQIAFVDSAIGTGEAWENVVLSLAEVDYITVGVTGASYLATILASGAGMRVAKVELVFDHPPA